MGERYSGGDELDLGGLLEQIRHTNALAFKAFMAAMDWTPLGTKIA